MSWLVQLPITVTTISQDVSLQKVPEDPGLPTLAQDGLSEDSSDYYSDESEAVELELENDAYRREISKNHAVAAQLELENDEMEDRIQQLEQDVARDERLCRRLRRRRSNRSKCPKRLTKSKSCSKSVPKGPKRRSHRKWT